MEDTVDPEQDQNIAEHKERVRFALAAARVGVFEWNPNSDRLTWSCGTTGLGLNPEDAPASGRAFFDFVHPDDQPAVLETRARALRDRTDADSEFRIVSPSGVVHWVRGYGRVVSDSSGRPLRVLGVNIEITRYKLLEEQLHEAHLQVAQLNVLKATTRTVQDIVAKTLTSLQLFRFDAEQHLSTTSLELFDRIVAETAASLKALGDVEHIAEKELAASADALKKVAVAPIILVEDDANDVFFVRHALEKALIQNPLHVVASAAEARERLISQPERLGPVLVVLDLNLGGPETGLDVLKWIRQQPEPLGSTPALMLTGSDRPTDREESSRLGAIMYLQKPVTEENLSRAVQALGFTVVTNLTSEKLGIRIIQRR